ncbi:MAG: tyrosine-type recombinase/integrase [Pseudomonadota bacterium]
MTKGSINLYSHGQQALIDLSEHHERVDVYDNPVDAYLDAMGTDASKETMGNVLRSVARIFGFEDPREVPWRLLNEQAVIKMLATLRGKKLSQHTVALYLAAVRGVARRAWRMKLITGETYEAIKEIKPKGEWRLANGRAVPPKELSALLRVCRDDKRMQGTRDAAMIWVLYGGGLRRSELVALDLGNMRERDQALLVRGKGSKERLVYLGDEAWGALRAWINEVRGNEPGPIFTRIRREDGLTMDRLSPKGVYYLLEKRCQQASIDPARPHDMRRSFISHLLEHGEDIATVQVMAGHSSVTTTQRYDKRGDARKKIAANKLTLGKIASE